MKTSVLKNTKFKNFFESLIICAFESRNNNPQMSTCLKHKNVISEFPSQDVMGQVSVRPSSFRSLVPQSWTPQQFADPAACCLPVSLKCLEMPFPSSHSDGLMDHLVSPSTPYPESGSLPLLANHWMSQLMCFWPGFIFAVTYQVCCTSCKIIQLLLHNLI